MGKEPFLRRGSLSKNSSAMKKRKNQFIKNCFKLFFGILLAGSFVLALFWGGLALYESNTANAALNRFVRQLQNKEYEEIMEHLTLDDKAELLSQQELESYLSLRYDGDLSRLSFVKKEVINEEVYYNIMEDGKFLATCKLKHKSASNKKWFVHLDVAMEEFTVYAPENTTILVNGKAVSEELAKTGIPTTYQGMKSTARAVKTDKYVLTDLNRPVIQAEASLEYRVLEYPEENSYCLLKKVTDVTDLEEMKSAMETTSKTYANYISEDATFAQLKKLVDTNTEYYKSLSTFSNRFFSEHDSFEFRNVILSDLYQFTVKDFMGEINFNYVVTKDGKEQVYTTHYVMYFSLQNETWKLTNLEVQ